MKEEDILENLNWLAPTPEKPIPPYVWVALGAAAFVLLVVLLLWRRKKKHGYVIPPPPPHQVALKALERLQSLLTEDNYLEFIIEVSRILRVYIQERFGLRAPHRSTEEFLAEARENRRLVPEEQEMLGEFLRQCDLVKFAKRRAALAQMKELFETAKRFVKETATAKRDEAETPAAIP